MSRKLEVEEMPEEEAAEVADVLRSYGLEDDKVATVVNSIRADKKRWVAFMMRFELGLEEPDPKRASRSAFTIAGSYIAGGLVPLTPYFLLPSVHSALIGSVVVTLLALLMFGYIKGRFTTARPSAVRSKRSWWEGWLRRRRLSLPRRWDSADFAVSIQRFGLRLRRIDCHAHVSSPIDCCRRELDFGFPARILLCLRAARQGRSSPGEAGVVLS